MVEISKLNRVINLAQAKLFKLENSFDSLDTVWEVMNTYKTITKQEVYVQYFIFDALSDTCEGYEGEEYQIVEVDSVRYIAPIEKQVASKEVAHKDAKVKKTNKELVDEVIAKEELVLDSYDSKLDKIPAKQFQKVLDAIGYGSSSSIHISFNNKDYIVEISEVDSEVDIWLITREEYESQYGEIYEEDWDA